jgi:hypothetical protein
MKGFVYLFVLSLLLINCKKDKDPEPLPEIADIAGRWNLTEQKYPSGDSTISANIDEVIQRDIFIRYDGVILYDGYAACCPTNKYLINGNLFNVVAKEDIPYDAKCHLVDCMPCDELIITQTGNTMTVVRCGRATSTYTRVN